MKLSLLSATALTLGASTAFAGGLDRTGSPIGILFEEGNYIEFTASRTNPSLSGSDLATGGSTGDVGLSYNSYSGSMKMDINDQFSFALILSDPYGADINYPVQATSAFLGGTSVDATATALDMIGRYKFNDNVSVHGGLRVQKASADINLAGAGYGPLNGYTVSLDEQYTANAIVGAAYEIPDIAMRVALTYFSAAKFDFDGTESLGGGASNTYTVDTKLPQSINLDFQTGIAADTLLFGGIRWAEWSSTKVKTSNIYGGTDLVELPDATTYRLGVGRRFNDTWSGSLSVAYEPSNSNDLVSPLAPTNGSATVAAGLEYTRDNMKIGFGVGYTELGNAYAQTADTERAYFSGNHAVTFATRIGFYF